VISKLAIEPLTDHLGRASPGAADNRDAPHSHYDREEPGYYSVYDKLELLVICVHTVKCAVSPTDPKREQVWFRNDEIEVLVVYLSEVFGGPRSRRLSSEVFLGGFSMD
jgi:hypothetical protein